MNPKFLIWLRALGIYLIGIVPLLGVPMMFAMAIIYGGIWALPALVLFWLMVRLLALQAIRPKLGYGITLIWGMLVCFGATYGAAWQFTNGHDVMEAYWSFIYFPGLALLGTFISLLLARKSLLAYYQNDDEA
jgi:hypothetical protein